MNAQPSFTVPEGHVTIEIDGRSLVVPRGMTIIQAADRAQIPIPRFCYHHQLPIVASCRMCLVDVAKSPRPSPACATPVADGMQVSTRSAKTLAYQRETMEFLLINHPLDCPICDQGGECELQDTALGYGQVQSRYRERKRVVADENLGPLVATHMTRCIHCTRCVRFTSEIAGTYELGGLSRGDEMQIGTYDGRPLQTELSGNVIDLCPVGALTNKVFAYRARPWELVARASIGYHDGFGSNVFLHHRRGDILRAVPKTNPELNGCWLADRDRYSHQGLSAPDRLTEPMCKRDGHWQPISWADALAQTQRILHDHSGDSLGILAHPSTSCEEGELLVRLATGLGTGNVDHRLGMRDFTTRVVAQPFSRTLADIEQAELVILFGTHVRHELPLLHARLRQAALHHHTQVIALNPVDFPSTIPLASRYLVPPTAMAATLLDAALVQRAQQAKQAVIITGEIVHNHSHASALRAAVHAFTQATGAALCAIEPGANAIGLAQLGVLPQRRDVAAMFADPRSGYLLYGIEPGIELAHFPNAMSALAAASTIAMTAYTSPELLALADLLLPIGLLPEVDAQLVNLLGHTQRVAPAGRLPGQAQAGWRVLRELGGAMELPGFTCANIQELRAQLQPRSVTVPPSLRIENASEGLELVTTTGIYQTDAVVRRANALQAHPLTTTPCLALAAETAAQLQLSDGQIATITTAQGTATLPVYLDARVAQQTGWVETGAVVTAPLSSGSVRVEAR